MATTPSTTTARSTASRAPRTRTPKATATVAAAVGTDVATAVADAVATVAPTDAPVIEGKAYRHFAAIAPAADALNVADRAKDNAEWVLIVTLAAATLMSADITLPNGKPVTALSILKDHEHGPASTSETSIIASAATRKHVYTAAQRIAAASSVVPADIPGDTHDAKVAALVADTLPRLAGITRSHIMRLKADKATDVLGAALDAKPGTPEHAKAIEGVRKPVTVQPDPTPGGEAPDAGKGKDEPAKGESKAERKAAKAKAKADAKDLRKRIGAVVLAMTPAELESFGTLLAAEFDADQLHAFRRAFVARANARTADIVVTPAPAKG